MSVIQDDDKDEDHDPAATFSGDGVATEVPGGGGTAQLVERCEDTTHEQEDTASAASTLPVTGEIAPGMWSEVDCSMPKDFTAEEFMATELAEKFFKLWKQGQVTDCLVGQRFGYGVLGKFYSRQDWEDGVFDDLEPEGEPRSHDASAEGGKGHGLRPIGDDALVEGELAESDREPGDRGVETTDVDAEDTTAGADGGAASASGSSAALSGATSTEGLRGVQIQGFLQEVDRRAWHTGSCSPLSARIPASVLSMGLL